MLINLFSTTNSKFFIRTGFQGILISSIVLFLLMLYTYLLIEMIRNFLLSYGFSNSDFSLEYFYSQLFLSLDNTLIAFFLLNLVYMFLFGMVISYMLTRHFSVVADLIRKFLADPKNSAIQDITTSYSNKYALTKFLHLFLQCIHIQDVGRLSFDTVLDFLKSQKKVIFEKHVLFEIFILFSILMAAEVYLMYILHTDLIAGIYDFVIKSIVIDNLSGAYIDKQVYLFSSFSYVFILVHALVLLGWIYFLINKIMNTNYGYLRNIRNYLSNKRENSKFVFIARKDDPTLECAQCFEDLFGYVEGIESNEK